MLPLRLRKRTHPPCGSRGFSGPSRGPTAGSRASKAGGGIPGDAAAGLFAFGMVRQSLQAPNKRCVQPFSPQSTVTCAAFGIFWIYIETPRSPDVVTSVSGAFLYVRALFGHHIDDQAQPRTPAAAPLAPPSAPMAPAPVHFKMVSATSGLGGGQPLLGCAPHGFA